MATYGSTTTNSDQQDAFLRAPNDDESRGLDRATTRIAILGAGCAGLCAIRALKARGFERITCFEAAPRVGGLWRENYDGFGLQVPKQLFEFPDFPFDGAAWGERASGAKVQAYIEAYAREFDLTRHVRCGSRVAKARLTRNRTWVLEPFAKEQFDFLVVCTGMYSAATNMPAFEDKGFDGSVVHSSEYVSSDQARGKRVVVIGGAKSAIDCALSAMTVSQTPPTLFFRSAHWPTPLKLAWLIPFQFVFLSRFGQALVSLDKGWYPTTSSTAGKQDSVLATMTKKYVSLFLVRPLIWLAFRVVELLFAVQLGCFGDRRPENDVVSDFYGFAHVLDPSFARAASKGDVVPRKGALESLGPGPVATFVATKKNKNKSKSGESAQEDDATNEKCIIPADLVICGTGFKKTYSSLFEDDVKASLDLAPDGLWLYRSLFPPRGPKNLAFVGSDVATISNVVTHAIHAEYVARLLAGHLSLPSSQDMVADVETVKAWKRTWMPDTSSRAALVLLHQIHYHDVLMRDMGETPYRKRTYLGELLWPYQPGDGDYDGLTPPYPEKTKFGAETKENAPV